MGVMRFMSADRKNWITQIVEFYEHYQDYIEENECIFDFESNISRYDIEPFHIVTLACLNQFLHDKDVCPWFSTNNESLYEYLYKDLKLAQYFVGNENHITSSSNHNVLNLWRIKDTEKDLYASRVESHFKEILHGKDTSSISLILKESFYNVFDHAQAGNNAFTFVQYKDDIIYVAVSDFGIGIVESVRNAYPTIEDDKAIVKSLEYGFTVRSTERNMGYGMDNMVKSTCKTKIYSDKYLVVCEKNSNFVPKTYEVPFKYPGTLLYFEIDTNDLEDEEIIEEFNF